MLNPDGGVRVSGARPPRAAVETITVADLECPETKSLVESWSRLRGWRAMPRPTDWLLGSAVSFSAHASLARVLDGGLDYQFEFIGEAHVRAYGPREIRSRVSELARSSPRFGRQLKASYDLVRVSGRPCAFRGVIVAEGTQARSRWFEVAYLPLGDHETVECIVNAAVYRPPNA